MTERKYRLPVNLFVLDAIGAILVFLGLFEWLSESSLVPDQYKFTNYHVVMVAVGFLLMLPVAVHFISRARGNRTR